MNRIKKIVRNIIIIIVLFLFIMNRSGLYFTPLAAHRSSERSIHYGPSKVIHMEDFKDGKYILGTYDKWVSCDTVNRAWLFFWHAGNQPLGFENDKSVSVNYTYMSSGQNHIAYGIINDKGIQKIEINLSSGVTLIQSDFYEDLFLFTWKSDQENKITFQSIRGYDVDDNIIYEEIRH